MAGKDGEVVYEIRGDDSRLDRDLSAAQQKVEQSVKKGVEKTEQIEQRAAEAAKESTEDVADHHAQQNDERVRDDEETGKQREEVEKSTSEKIKNIAGGTAKAVGAGMLAVGTVAVAVGGMAVKSATDMDQAMNQFAAATGKSTDETERYQKVLEDIYTNNYGEDFQDIAGAMADVNKQLGDMTDAQLREVTESAFALRDTFGYEIPESILAARAMMDNFGISGDEAMNLIAAGAQNGLDYSGELIDSISEYSVHFAKVGMDADDMFKIFQQGAESGAWSLDKIGDAVKEFSIRAIDGSEAAKAGFEAVGMNADDMAAKFAAGGDSAKSAFQETINGLAGMKDPLEQNAAGIALFGTMWEDLGPEVVAALADIGDAAYAAGDEMNQIKDIKYDDLGSVFEGLKRSAEMLLVPLGEQLIPVLMELIEAVLPMLEEALPPLMDVIGELIEQLAPIIENILPVLIDVFSQLLSPLMELIEAVMPVLLDLFVQLIPPLMEIIDAVLPVLVELFTLLIPPLVQIINAVLPVFLQLINALLPVLQALLPVLNPLIECFAGLLDPILQLISSALAPLIEALTPVISTVVDLLVPALQVLLSVVQEVFTGIAGFVQDQIKIITTILNELIDFVKNVFTGNWSGAWENIKNIFGSIADGMKNMFKAPLNFIIDQINGLLKGLNGIKIPDWVPGVGGKSFSIPTIPRLKTGIDFVPGDYFPAYLDYGERVLTQQENIRFNALGGLSGMEASLSQGNYKSESKIVLGKGCIVVQSNIDGKAAAQAMAPYVDMELGASKEIGKRDV